MIWPIGPVSDFIASEFSFDYHWHFPIQMLAILSVLSFVERHCFKMVIEMGTY